jgi:multiple sugar transport system permease protein
MSRTQHVVAAAAVAGERPQRPSRRHAARPELFWAAAFVAPYAAVMLTFGAYPLAVALWMGGSPGLYAQLADEPLFWSTVVNTLVFVGVGVNLKLFTALLLSGFFLQRRWWIKPLLVIFVVPWFIATVQAFISFHWMLIGQYGFIDGMIELITGISGPDWFNERWLALGCNIVAYVWKWLPLWTLVFIAGRLAIPTDIYDAAAIDGAAGMARFTQVTFPLLAHLYLVATLLATLWAFGDFATTYFVSGGAPVNSTNVLATLSYRLAFDAAQPAIGVAAALSALPVVIPAILVLMRRLQTRELQL